MAWDFGLAHPDLFAGVVVDLGPAVQVRQPLPRRTPSGCPLYVAIGDLAPAANEVVFGEVLKPMIAKAYDVTYLEYFRRGLEDLPEEAPAVFDWMDRRRRDPYPKKFDVVTARPSRQPLLRRRRPRVPARPDDGPRGRRAVRQEPQPGHAQDDVEHA